MVRGRQRQPPLNWPFRLQANSDDFVCGAACNHSRQTSFATVRPKYCEKSQFVKQTSSHVLATLFSVGRWRIWGAGAFVCGLNIHNPRRRITASFDGAELILLAKHPQNKISGGKTAPLLTLRQPCAYVIWVVSSGKPSRPLRRSANVRRCVALPGAFFVGVPLFRFLCEDNPRREPPKLNYRRTEAGRAGFPASTDYGQRKNRPFRGMAKPLGIPARAGVS